MTSAKLCIATRSEALMLLYREIGAMSLEGNELQDRGKRLPRFEVRMRLP